MNSMSVSMSKTLIGGAVRREFESEEPATEEMLDRVSYAAANSLVFRHALKVVMVAKLFEIRRIVLTVLKRLRFNL